MLSPAALGSFLGLLNLGRIDPLRKQLLRLLASLASFLEADRRVGTKRQRFLLAVVPKCETPQLPTGRCQIEVETAAIKNFARPRAGLGVSAFGIREWHGGVGILLSSCWYIGVKIPTNPLDANECLRSELDNLPGVL